MENISFMQCTDSLEDIFANIPDFKLIKILPIFFAVFNLFGKISIFCQLHHGA